MVDTWIGEIGKDHCLRLATPNHGLMCIEGQQDSLEASEGLSRGSTRKVDTDDGGEEVEDNKLEARVGGLKGVIQPAAKVVITGAGIGTT